MNPVEPYEVRIAAFLMTMRTKPSLTVMELIAHSLRREDNLQLGSFVYSYLRTVATSRNPILSTLLVYRNHFNTIILAD